MGYQLTLHLMIIRQTPAKNMPQWR